MNRVAKLACLAVLCYPIFTGIVRSAQAQAGPQDAATISTPQRHRKRTRVHRHHRAQGHGADARRQAHAGRYLPAQGRSRRNIPSSSSALRTTSTTGTWSLGAPRDMSTELEAVKRGYAYVEMNERGRYFSEGDYDILGRAPH